MQPARALWGNLLRNSLVSPASWRALGGFTKEVLYEILAGLAALQGGRGWGIISTTAGLNRTGWLESSGMCDTRDHPARHPPRKSLVGMATYW